MHASTDSRNFGPVPYDLIEGKALLRVSLLYSGIFFSSSIVVMKYTTRKFSVCFSRSGHYDALGH